MIKKLERIIENGGICKYNIWKEGNHVDGDLYIYNYEDALRFAKENDADEIEVGVWYSEKDFNDGMLADDYVTVYHR